MIRWVLASAVLIVAPGCTDTGAAAEKRYEMVERTGSRGEICEAGKTVVDAYLKAGNEKKYKWWHSISDINCLNAELSGRNGRPDQDVVENVQ